MLGPSWSRHPSCCAVVAAAVMFVARPSWGAEQVDEGRKFFDVGAQAYAQGEYGAAITAFKEAHRLTRRPGLLFSLAQAYRRAFEMTGQPEYLQAAVQYYESYRALGPADERRQQADDHLKRLRAQASSQGIDTTYKPESTTPTQIVIGASVKGATLRIDGSGSRSLPHAAVVTAGKHTVEVTAPGYRTFRKQVTVAEGEVVGLSAELTAESATLEVTGNDGGEVFVNGHRVGVIPTGVVALPVSGPRDYTVEVRQAGYYTPHRLVTPSGGPMQLHMPADATPQRIASWVLVGAGAAGLVAGGVLGVLAMRTDADGVATKNELIKDPANQRLRQDLRDTEASRDRLVVATTVTVSAGLVAGAAGVIMWLASGPGPVRHLRPSSDGVDGAAQSSTSGWRPTLSASATSFQFDLRSAF